MSKIQQETYLNMWRNQVDPHIRNKDFASAKYEADMILCKLTDDIGARKLSHLYYILSFSLHEKM